jgi:hypothetical protein
VESAGPVDFGQRLLENSGAHAWHAIIYEKGAWIMHMLRMRLGDEGFHALQARLLSEFQNKQVNNEDFRRVAASLVAAGQPDQSLTGFFENWIYATGLPQIKFQSKGSSVALKISGVDDGFSLDLPLSCVGPNGTALVVWMHAGSGDNSLDVADGAHSCQLPKPTEYLYSAAF